MAEIHHERVLRLIELIYDAASDPAGWKVFLEELVDLTGGTGASLSGFDFRVSGASVQIGVGNMGGAFQREYEQYAHLDPYVIKGRAHGMFKTGVIGLGDDYIPFSELERTEFYRLFASRHAYIGGLAAIITSTGTSGTGLGMSRRREQLFDSTHVELVRLLMPHLQRAWHLHVQLADSEQRRASFAEALNRLTVDVLIAGPGGTVLYANESARALLAESDGLTLERGLLRGARSQDTKALSALITDALSPVAAVADGGGVVLLRRPSGRRPLRAIVSPLPPDERIAITDSRALIYIVDPDRETEADIAMLRRALGLSKAEGDVAALLMQDKSVSEIGKELGTTVHTVRFHIKQLFAKTGVSRQSALVRLLTTTAQVRLTRPS